MESRQVVLETEHDIATARNAVRALAAALGFRAVDQTRLATVASELARNAVKYAVGGRLTAQEVTDEWGRRGLRLLVEDDGPGIDDVDRALRDGYSTGGGLGKGLPGSRRLVDEFAIESRVGAGTRVDVTRWLT